MNKMKYIFFIQEKILKGTWIHLFLSFILDSFFTREKGWNFLSKIQIFKFLSLLSLVFLAYLIIIILIFIKGRGEFEIWLFLLFCKVFLLE